MPTRQSLDSLETSLEDESLRKSMDEREAVAAKAAEALKNDSAFSKQMTPRDRSHLFH